MMKTEKNPSSLTSIPMSIWGIGFATLLMNLSSIIVFSLSPVYLTSVLGVTAFGIGIFEGAVEALAWTTRIFSGIISDYWQKRKPLLFMASAFAAISRPFFALAPSVGWIFFARSLDRIGNGLQATPREALVGDHAPPHLKGTCYGLRQTLSVIGSLIGAIAIYYWIQDSHINYAGIFWGASVPPLIALVIIYYMVKDTPAVSAPGARRGFVQSIRHIRDLDPGYWRVIVVAFVFMLSNYSGAFMILHAQHVTKSVTIAPQTMIFQNLATMLAAFPVGRLSDRMDRRIFLAIGFVIAIAANFLLGFADSKWMVLGGATLWGFQLGITQSLFVTKVADHAAADLRGTGFGIYYILIGFSLFLANYQAGWLSHNWGSVYTFMASSVYAFIALLCLPLIKADKKAC